MEKMDPQTSKTGKFSADVRLDLSEAYSTVELPAEGPEAVSESTENYPEENGGSNEKKRKRNILKEKAKAEDETQNMDQTNINTGSTEIITEENVNGKRKRGSRLSEEIKNMNQVNSLSKVHSSDSNLGKGIEGKGTENECLAKDFEIDVRKESSFSVSVHNKENPLELCKDEEVEISRRRESPLVDLMQTENHLSIYKDKETVSLPGMVEGSSKQVLLKIVGERSERYLRPTHVERKFIPSEGELNSLPFQMAGENVMIENGLNQLRDEVVINEGQCSAENGNMKEAECLSNDLEHNPGMTPVPSRKKKLVVQPVPSKLRKLIVQPVPSITRKLIVLDVNGLLANIVMPAPRDYRGDTHILGRAIFKRPFCDDFLKFCFHNFVVGVWSSRSKRIIDGVVDYLLGDQKDKLLFCWDMSHSTQTGFSTLENIQKPLVFKELKKIWDNDDHSLPWRNGDYNESNTLLLDDSPYKALLNPLYTAIFPNSYHYKDGKDNSLGPGGDLRVYLEGLLSSENVQTYVEQHPFGQSAINETNLSWGFYSGVLQTMSEQLQDDTILSSLPMSS